MAGIPGATPGSIGSFSELETPNAADLFEVESPSEGTRRITRAVFTAQLTAALEAAEVFVTPTVLTQAVNAALDEVLDESIPGVVTSQDALAGTAQDAALWSAELVHLAAKRAARTIDLYSLPVTTTTGALDMATAQSFVVSAATGRVVTITNPPTGRSAVIVVRIMGNGTLTWPAGINWVGGSTPALGSNFTLVSILFHAGTYVGIRSAAFDN